MYDIVVETNKLNNCFIYTVYFLAEKLNTMCFLFFFYFGKNYNNIEGKKRRKSLMNERACIILQMRKLCGDKFVHSILMLLMNGIALIFV